jgi:cytochrome c oxidase assembly protein subunit 15
MAESHSARSNRALALWLFCCAAMVFLIVVIGGITRLTESGLSITEWKPVTGVVPPLSEEQWLAEFARYQNTTEYQLLNRGMSLEEFRVIFFWEYLHRLWGRLVGLVFVVPLVYFAMRRRIPAGYPPRLLGIFVLIVLQGALGWYMVQSGLSGRTDVSQYRLAAHLALALFVYVLLLWTGLALYQGGATRARDESVMQGGARARVITMLTLVALTIVSGAFVAGLNAGKVYNTFPLMGENVVPREYGELSPWPVNLTENAAAVQFNHRILALVTLGVVMHVFFWARRRRMPPLASAGINGAAALALLQVGLGIATLLLGAPVGLSAAHQVGAVSLLTAAVVALRGLEGRYISGRTGGE